MKKPLNEEDQLRDLAVFANELSDLFQRHDRDDLDAAIEALLLKFAPSVEMNSEYCIKLINAGFEKLKQYAPIFEINVASSSFCKSVRSWLDLHADEGQPEVAVEKRA